MRRSILALAAVGLVASTLAAVRAPAPTPGVAALAPIVGEWRSVGQGAISAVSRCGWTPQHLAVVCDQSISMPDGLHHAVNLYVFDPIAGRYFFYGVNRPGDPLQAVPLSVDGAVWTYGGAPARDGTTYRTVNDFSEAPRAYSWRRESSPDGKHWTIIARGRSERVAGSDKGR